MASRPTASGSRSLVRSITAGVYAEYGVRHCWYLDPIARTLEVFALSGTKWLVEATFKDADPVSAPPFEVHTFSLAVLWADTQSSAVDKA